MVGVGIRPNYPDIGKLYAGRRAAPFPDTRYYDVYFSGGMSNSTDLSIVGGTSILERKWGRLTDIPAVAIRPPRAGRFLWL